MIKLADKIDELILNCLAKEREIDVNKREMEILKESFKS